MSFVTHTIKLVFILGNTYFYLSSCTYVSDFCYIHLYEYLDLVKLTIICVFLKKNFNFIYFISAGDQFYLSSSN